MTPRRELTKPLPSDESAEQAILATIMLDNGVASQATAKLVPDDFYSPMHRDVYRAILELIREQKQIDPVTVSGVLRRNGSLDGYGGAPAITNLTIGVPWTNTLDTWVDAVKERSTRRALIREAWAIQDAALADDTPTAEIIERSRNRIRDLSVISKDAGLEIEFLDTVEAKQVEWLASPLIPFGFFTLMDGVEGIGKTFAMLDISKRLANGLPMPFSGERHSPSNVLFLSVEDSPEYILKPRFEAMGGDCSKLAVLRGHFDFSVAGFSHLESTIQTHSIRLVLIDPIFSFTGTADINNTADVRPITDRLNAIAARYGIAIIGIRHVNKSKGFGEARSAGGHSVAWLQGCRSGLMVGHDADDKSKRGIAQHKLNVGPGSDTVYGFHIDGDGVFHWTGESSLTVSEMLSHKSHETNEDRSAIAEAIKFLQLQLANGPVQTSSLKTDARGSGISERTLERAKARLNVKAQKSGLSGTWFWEMPEAGK
ncbi:MAG: AAA family ATPase [Pyrinomonadaceae bacterium]